MVSVLTHPLAEQTELSATNWGCTTYLARALGSVEAHVATNPIERQHLQNEIDALVAHLYRLSEDELQHILYAPYTFPLVERMIKDGVMTAFARVEEMLK
jgi:cyanate lyase